LSQLILKNGNSTNPGSINTRAPCHKLIPRSYTFLAHQLNICVLGNIEIEH